MKKVYNSTDIHPKQGQELSKKLYRTISEQVKRLDDARRCARNIKELFTPSLQLQRRKLCDYCERLIFSDPLLYGKKIEGLLWHNGFYDVVSNAKRLKKNEYTADDISNIQTHINAGIGYYHHLISKIQSEYSLNLGTVIDFSVQLESCGESNDVKPEIIEWAQLAVHQCLIYLGDLSRYKLEIYPNWEPTLAIRYYLQAILFRPEYGMPHNQLGTLAMSQSKYLDAVYHYMRCLASKFTFDGTANNLHNLFDMNSKFIEQLPDENQNPDCIIEPGKTENIKRFIARFLLLIDIWYFNKKVSKLYSLCHQTYKDLGECLSYLKPVSSESGDTPTDIDSIESDSTAIPTYLNNDILFKIMVICLLCISKLKQSNSQQLSAVIAFTLAIYSQIIQHITNHIQESVMNYPLNTETKSSEVNGLIKNLVLGVKKSKTKMRRRKPMKADSEDESEHSANDDEDNYSSSDDSFISDTENVLACSSDEEGDTTKDSDECKSDLQDGDILEVTEGAGLDESKSTENLTKKVQKMDVNDMLEIIGEESNLQCIKIAHDWLKYDPEVIKSCGTNTRSLLRQITHLLNLININLTSPKVSGITIKISEIISKENKIPLSEDIVLKGVDILSNAHSDIDWDFIHKRTFTAKDETVIRIVKLISFGKHLMTIDDTGISFDVEKNIFVCQVIEEDDIKLPASVVEELELNDIESNTLFVNKATNLGDGDSNGALVETKGGQLMKMKHMGQLWLAAEVRALECRVKGKTSLSPYLVLDADALIKFTFMVKHLVHSRKFIVLVPTAVVSALDDLKLEKSEARDAIRWLESQFQRGNRFFRAQRPHEKASIPFIKYPKKKDKEMHIYIQIIECCHYLAEQQKDATNLVTLLIGNQNVLSNGENKEFSYVGLAQSAGISIESITQFYGKWKKTKGKR